MDAIGWSGEVYAAAAILAKTLTTEELTRLSLLFTQLGTTLGTIAALQPLEEETEGGDAAASDLSAL